MESGSELKPKIECLGVSKSFYKNGKEIPILAKMDLSVYENEFVVILGPGQSGKTTLFRMIAGLEMPNTGKILVDGKEVTGPGKHVGIVFQRYMVFPWKTVLANIELGLKLSRLPKNKRREIAKHYIDLVGLNGYEKSYPHELSGGMKQRVGIARAYANNPDILLMDEPFGQLDAQTRILMEQETMRILQTEKKTVCFITNNIDEALYLGDRIIVLDGKLPGRMHKIHSIELSRPRDFTDRAFLELRQKIIDETQLIL